MAKSKLQKKFFKGEMKISSLEIEMDPSFQISQIKSQTKREDLPPALPLEGILSKSELLINEISSLLNRHFDSCHLSDSEDVLSSSPMTVDCILGALKMVGNLNSYPIFQKKVGFLLLDCDSKSLLLKVSFELENQIWPTHMEEFVSNLYPKLCSMLSPYGGNCIFRETDDLINKKRNFSFIFTLNRLELFSLKEVYEENVDIKYGAIENAI